MGTIISIAHFTVFLSELSLVIVLAFVVAVIVVVFT